MDRQQIRFRWNEIVKAIEAAGIPRDELSLLAIVTGAQLLSDRFTRMVVREARPIGFAPPARKEEQ
jgi:hypothetical protein